MYCIRCDLQEDLTESHEDDVEPTAANDNRPVAKSAPPPNIVCQASTSTAVSEPLSNKPFKRAYKKLSPADEVLAVVGKRLAEAKKEDDCDVFAKNVAAKLRKLSKEQRLFAEKVINETLFEAELGTLTRYATITTGSLVRSSPMLTHSSPPPSMPFQTFEYQMDQRDDVLQYYDLDRNKH